MKIDTKFLNLIDKIQSGHKVTQDECAFLLQFPETSLESAVTRGVVARALR